MNLVGLFVCPRFPKPPKLPDSWNFGSRPNLGQLKTWRSPIFEILIFKGGSPYGPVLKIWDKLCARFPKPPKVPDSWNFGSRLNLGPHKTWRETGNPLVTLKFKEKSPQWFKTAYFKLMECNFIATFGSRECFIGGRPRKIDSREKSSSTVVTPCFPRGNLNFIMETRK